MVPMPTYAVWYKNDSNGEAPEQPFLDDYTWAGNLDATGPKDLANQLVTAKEDDEVLDKQRRFQAGDVIETGGRYLILTPQTVWAQCSAIPPDPTTTA